MFKFVTMDGPAARVTLLGGPDLASAYIVFAAECWPQGEGAVAVWHNDAVVGRVVPWFDQDAGEVVPRFEEWPR